MRLLCSDLRPGRLVLVFAAVVAVAGAFTLSARAAVPVTWCGGSSVANTDRKPDLLAGNEVNVIYAHPSDASDRLGQFASSITTDIAAIDAWWRKQDSTRTPRFDLFAFPGCASTYGKLDLADMTLPQPTSYYYSLGTRFDRILNDLGGPPFYVNDPTRKYVIYYDASVSDPNVCGQGGGYSDLYSRGPSWAVIYTQSCGLVFGDGNHGAHVVAHELIHSLGAVTAGAPHDCAPPNDGHVCDSSVDILWPFLMPDSVFDTEVLDVNHDDYYANGGAFDIRNSSWLQHLDLLSFALTVTSAGSGTGTVTSDVGGINCPPSCSSTQTQGTAIKLTATPAAASKFTGWSGACTGTGVCTVTLDGAKNVTATFAKQQALTVSVDASRASGSVVSEPAGISCPGTCSATFESGTTVKLIAQPGTGSRLEQWGGACSGRGDCSVAVTDGVSVSATFGAANHTLAVALSGKGTVVSSPAGISCPRHCSTSLAADTLVSLRAVPAKGYAFAGWSGDCHGRGACAVTLTGDLSERATFKKKR